MGRSRVLAIIFILLIVSVTSHANIVFTSRKLVDLASPTEQISASNTSVKSEKEVDSSTVTDKKSEIGKGKPENPAGSSEPTKPGPEELKSTKVDDGSLPAETQKRNDPQVSDDGQSSTKVNDGSSKAGSERPKDPQGSNDPSKVEPKEAKSAVDGESTKAELEKPKDPQPQGSNDSTKLDPHGPKNDNVTAESSLPVDKENEAKKNIDDTVKGNDEKKSADDTVKENQETKNVEHDGKKNADDTVKEKQEKKNVDDTVKKNDEKYADDTVKENQEKKNVDDTVKENEEKKNIDDTVKENEEKKNVDDTVKENEEKKNVDDTVNSEVNTDVSCQGATKMCRVEQTLLACIRAPPIGSAELFLVVQNEGEKGVKVNLNIQPPLDNSLQAIKLAKHQSKKIDISSILGKDAEIVLNTGDGSCRLQLQRRVSVDNIMQQVSLYSKRVTPIYGAYFAFLVALLSGGTWACCKLRKKRHQDGVAYQELEMGIPESTSAANVVTADGWDQDWDDDWDEENAVKSPGGRTFGNISANGLTSRSSKRDGWENDWDD